MSGMRLLDVVALLSASRTVALKYIAIQKHQLKVYGKTSSLSKSFEAQVNKFPVASKTASDLANLFNPQTSASSNKSSGGNKAAYKPRIREETSVGETQRRGGKIQSLEQAEAFFLSHFAENV